MVWAQATPAPAQNNAANLVSNGLSVAATGGGLTNACGADSQNCIATIIGRIIGAALGFVEIILFCLVLYAGFIWMTAGGDSKKVDTAKSMIVNAVAGIIIIAASYLIANFILDTLQTQVFATPPAAP